MSKFKIPLRRVTSVVLSYGLAVVSVVIALGLALLTQLQTVHNLEFPLFLMAIAVTVWYAGTGPGVLAGVLSGLSFDYFFTPPCTASTSDLLSARTLSFSFYSH